MNKLGLKEGKLLLVLVKFHWEKYVSFGLEIHNILQVKPMKINFRKSLLRGCLMFLHSYS